MKIHKIKRKLKNLKKKNGVGGDEKHVFLLLGLSCPGYYVVWMIFTHTAAILEFKKRHGWQGAKTAGTNASASNVTQGLL